MGCERWEIYGGIEMLDCQPPCPLPGKSQPPAGVIVNTTLTGPQSHLIVATLASMKYEGSTDINIFN